MYNLNYFVADCLVIYEDERLGARARGTSLSGPELASLMKIGTRVVRGRDWKWGDQVSYQFNHKNKCSVVGVR